MKRRAILAPFQLPAARVRWVTCRKWSRIVGTALAACLLLLLAGPAVAQDTEAQAKARLAQERDPVKRARLQIRLADFRLDEGRKQYEEGGPEQGLAQLQQMLSLVLEAQDGLFGTGKNPRKRPRGFKEVEIKLRELSRRLEDLRVSIPTEERGEVEKIAGRLLEIRERLLHGLMNVKEKKK